MIRLYEVVFDHKEHGDNYCAATVAVEGDALAAIDKALRGEPKHANDPPLLRWGMGSVYCPHDDCHGSERNPSLHGNLPAHLWRAGRDECDYGKALSTSGRGRAPRLRSWDRRPTLQAAR